MKTKFFLHTILNAALVVSASAAFAGSSPGNRLTYLDDRSPFYVGADFPRLTTPMWFGEDGVDAVIILSIDDMQDTAKYQTFLEPIVNRLREIEGRSPLSIFTNSVNPSDPQLEAWLKQGVRFDVHTRTHPCPLLKGTFEGAVANVLDCVTNVSQIPGGPPVAFRMPCCDSINSASPRFFSEILPLRTREGHFLEGDSSVLMFLSDFYRAYAPFRNYAATAQGYPYPYVIGKLTWEFPIIAPSDWQAQNRQGPFSPITVADMEAGIDLVVKAQGLFTLCFHPHGWIRNDQIVELIDHAAGKHGKRVRFLNFHEALDRLQRNLLGGLSLRASDGSDNGVRLLDVNADGYLDVVIGNEERRETRVWDVAARKWRIVPFPFRIVARNQERKTQETGVRFGVLDPSGNASALVLSEEEKGLARFDGDQWVRSPVSPIEGLRVGGQPILTEKEGHDRGVRLRDLDGDGLSDLLVNNDEQNALFRWDVFLGSFHELPFSLPSLASLVDGQGRDRGLRFVDADSDGRDDVILSNDDEYYLYLFDGPERGWARRVLHGPSDGVGALPKIVSAGKDRGAWFKDGVMYVMNEETAKKPDFVDIRRFDVLIENMETPPVEPEAALKLFQVPPGFRVELAAAEPLVTDPISIEFGPDGLAWVVEMGSYPLGQGKDSGGRVKVLRDVDGDHRFDQSGVFADGFSFPTCALPLGRGVLVACAPDIFYLEDKDGDGRADEKRVVFTGFGEGNQQHRVNGLHYAIDNWIYGANGDSGGKISIVAHPELPSVSIGGRDFRFLPTLDAFEAESGHTQYGLAMDDFGNRFGASNARHIMHSVLPERYLRRNPYYAAPDPVLDIPDHGAMARVYPISKDLISLNAVHVPGHFSSACGIAIYRGENFPPEYRGNAFVCEPVGNLVHRDVLVSAGATFLARRGEENAEFLASSDHWFRPVYAATGPDGALYVVDMYRFVIEHPEYIPEDLQQILDFTAGRDRGRIYRVVYGEGPGLEKKEAQADLNPKSTKDLVAYLEHPNGWWRDAAQRLLVARKDSSAAPLLRRLYESTTRAETRVHALWTLEGLRELDEFTLLSALAYPHPRVREHALRLAEPLLGRSTKIAAAVLALVRDESPRVRVQTAFTLGEMDSDGASQALGHLLERDVEDRWMRAAFLSSSYRRSGSLLSQFFSDPVKLANTSTVWREVLQGLVHTVSRKGDLREIKSLFTNVQSPDRVERWHFILLSSLDARRDDFDEKETRGIQTILARALDTAFSGEAEVAARIEAVKALGSWSVPPSSFVPQLLHPGSALELQLAIVSSLARAPNKKEAATWLLASWGNAGPSVRAEVLEALLSSDEGASALLDAVESGRLRSREIDQKSRERLYKGKNADLQARAAKLLPEERSEDREAVVKRYASAVAGKGDSIRGKMLFLKHCSSCHQLEGEGYAVGPDLTEARAKGDAEIIEAILNPSRVVPPRFAPYVVETKSKGIATGLISSETATSITLLRANGVSETILRADVQSLAAGTESLMPADLDKAISEADMADLLAYLRAQPRLLGSLTPREVEEARQRILKDGHDGLREVIRAAEHTGQSSFVGFVNMPFVRQLDGKSELVWRSDPAPATQAAGSRCTFHFPAAMGYKSQPSGSFILYLGDQKLLDFDVSLETKAWKSDDGNVVLQYTVRARNAEDSTGEMTLELPSQLVEPGKPVTLHVTGSATGSRRWFGLLPLR